MKIQALLTLVIVLFCTDQVVAQSAQEANEDLVTLADLERSAKRSFLLLFKLGSGEVVAPANAITPGEYWARINKDGTPVFRVREDESSIMRYLRLNDEFKIIQRSGAFVQIALDTEQTAWVKDADISWVQSENKPKGQTPVKNKIDRAQWEIATKVYERLDALETQFNERLASAPQSAASAKLETSFRRHLSNARQFYQNNFSNLQFTDEDQEPQERISGNITLSRGSSKFTDTFSDESEITQQGGVGDIQIGLGYRIDENSSARFAFSNNKEVLGTPFTNRNVQFGYETKLSRSTVRTSLSHTKYTDELRDINSYGRLGFQGNITHELSGKSELSAGYRLVNNTYELNTIPDFTQHLFNAHARLGAKGGNNVLLGARGHLSSSDRNDLNSTLLAPEVLIRKKKDAVQKETAFRIELFDFPDLPLRNSSRYSVKMTTQDRSSAEKTKRQNLLLAYTTQVENAALDHVRFTWQTSESKLTEGYQSQQFGITAKYFTENTDASYTDLTWNFSRGEKLKTALSTFGRFWFPDNGITYLLESNLRVGIPAGNFRLGPVVSVRSLMNTNSITFEGDGNNFRLGAFIEGTQEISKDLTLNLNGAYHYAQVYSTDFTVGSDGLIIPGEVQTRNPTTFRMSAQLNYRLKGNFDLFAAFDHYRIERNFAEDQGFDTVQESKRLSTKFGITYRYN